MEPWIPLISAAAGFVVRGQCTRLGERGRLPEQIERHLAIWDKMPDSQVKTDLREHIELQMRYLLAHETPPTVQERSDRRWGLLWAFAGFVLLPGIGVVEGWSLTWIAWAAVAGAVVASVGLTVWSRGRAGQHQRRWDRFGGGADLF